MGIRKLGSKDIKSGRECEFLHQNPSDPEQTFDLSETQFLNFFYISLEAT